MADLPTATVTLLFTDIEGSTRLLKHLGGCYPGLLTEFRQLVRTAVEAKNAQEISTQGDAFFVAFRSAREGLAAAVAAQRAIANHPWPAGAVVRVRMGLHTGEALSTSAGLVGMDVHRGARICAAAHGGQILLSDTTHALVVNGLPTGLALRDLGQHRLKDLVHPQRLFQVVAEGLPADFPPLQTLDSFRNNLPRQLTSFIGREREMAEVKKLLTTTNLLTLTGTGGAGKTRLALQVAADLLDRYPEGVWLTELASMSDPALVPKAVASALGVPEQPGRPLDETLLDHLRPKSVLLVLDNCEHLLGACARLADSLLRGCPNLRILATSREGLGVTGESLYPVPSLSVPDPNRLPLLENLMQYEAVRLFVERATLSDPKFQLTSGHASGVAQVCCQLDGIPLALELAAARVKVLAVEQIASRLYDRFRLLTGGSRTAFPRHQTLRAAMDWGYDLLAEKERALLRRLSVCAGGWVLEAAEAICAGGDLQSHEVLDLLAHLVDKSLMFADVQSGEARYRLLETVRQYAWERLVESGEAANLKRLHQVWFLAFAERAEPRLRGDESRMWLKRLETEHDNLRAALEWTRTQDGGAEAELRLAGALGWFWTVRGHWNEARARLEAALARSNGASTHAQIKVLQRLALLVLRHGDYRRATALSEQALVLCREFQDKGGTALSLDHLGMVALRQHDWGRATTLFEESLVLFREVENKWFISMELAQLGMVARSQGDYERAVALHTKSLALFREVGDEYYGIPYALRSLGFVALFQGKYAQAETFYREGLALCKGFGDPWIAEECLEGLAGVACAQEDYQKATRLFGVAEALRETLGDRLSAHAIVMHDRGVAAMQAALGEPGFEAAWAQGRAMTLEQAIDYALEEA